MIDSTKDWYSAWECSAINTIASNVVRQFSDMPMSDDVDDDTRDDDTDHAAPDEDFECCE